MWEVNLFCLGIAASVLVYFLLLLKKIREIRRQYPNIFGVLEISLAMGMVILSGVISLIFFLVAIFFR